MWWIICWLPVENLLLSVLADVQGYIFWMRSPEDGLKYPLPICWTSNNNSEVLFFAMKDEVMAVEMATGKILWWQEL